jgi:hypothetical protein
MPVLKKLSALALTVCIASVLSLGPAAMVSAKKSKLTASGTLTRQPGNPGQVNYAAKFSKPVDGYEIVLPGRTIESSALNFCSTLTIPSPSARVCMNSAPFKKPTGSLFTTPDSKKGQGGKLFGFLGKKKVGPFVLTGP